jgi:hypothetical protein
VDGMTCRASHNKTRAICSIIKFFFDTSYARVHLHPPSRLELRDLEGLAADLHAETLTFYIIVA